VAGREGCRLSANMWKKKFLGTWGKRRGICGSPQERQGEFGLNLISVASEKRDRQGSELDSWGKKGKGRGGGKKRQEREQVVLSKKGMKTRWTGQRGRGVGITRWWTQREKSE